MYSADTASINVNNGHQKKMDKSFEVNRRGVLATRRIGKGCAGLKKWCGVMNIPEPMNVTIFGKNENIIGNKVPVLVKDNMANAVQAEVKTDGSRDLTFTTDGAWQKGGFTSNLGIVTVMSTNTDQVLDVAILCKECKGCTRWEGKKISRIRKVEAQSYM